MENTTRLDMIPQKPILKTVAATATLAAYETAILVVNGAYTITLPKLAEAAGRIYSFSQPGSGTSDVTITDAGDDSVFTDQIIDAQNENVILYCDGIRWFALAGQTS